MRMAIVKIDATEAALVENIIEVEPDEAGGFSHWTCPEGFRLIEAGDNVSADWLWDGNELLPPPVVPTPRVRELMRGETEVRLPGPDGGTAPKTAETLEAESAELLGILLDMINAGQQLTEPQLQKLVQLNIAKGGS